MEFFMYNKHLGGMNTRKMKLCHILSNCAIYLEAIKKNLNLFNLFI